MKTYYETVKSLKDYQKELFNSQRSASERLQEVESIIDTVKENYTRTYTKEERDELNNELINLQEEKKELQEQLKIDYNIKLLEIFDRSELDELKEKAKAEHAQALQEARKHYEKVDAERTKALHRLNAIDWHSDYKKAEKHRGDIERRLERISEYPPS